VYVHEPDVLYPVREDDFETPIVLRVDEPAQSDPSINWAPKYIFDERWPP
jgi:hypothetical protein